MRCTCQCVFKGTPTNLACFVAVSTHAYMQSSIIRAPAWHAAGLARTLRELPSAEAIALRSEVCFVLTNIIGTLW